MEGAPQSLLFTSGRLFPPLDFFNAETFKKRDCLGIVKQSLSAVFCCAEKEMCAIPTVNVYFQ